MANIPLPSSGGWRRHNNAAKSVHTVETKSDVEGKSDAPAPNVTGAESQSSGEFTSTRGLSIRRYVSPYGFMARRGKLQKEMVANYCTYRRQSSTHGEYPSPLGPCACLASERIPPEGLRVRGVNVLQRSGFPASGLHAVHFI